MQNNISSIIKSRIPSAIAEDSDNLRLFLSAYYEYLSKQKNASWLINKNPSVKDIDTTLEEFITHFYSTYAEYFPKNSAYDRASVIKKISELYKLKGTEPGAKLFFKMVFNEDIEVTYPYENVLAASDGKWEQDFFITVTPFILSGIDYPSTISGLTIYEGARLRIKNTSGYFVTDIKRVEFLEQIGSYRIYFFNTNPIVIGDKDTADIIDADSKLMFRGTVTTRYNISKLRIKQAGKNFKVGQIFSIPGSYKETKFRIKEVDAGGTIRSLEIIDFGFVHGTQQTVSISPFGSKLIPNGVSVTTEILSPTETNYRINIADYTPGLTEVIGVQATITDIVQRYYVAGYLEPTLPETQPYYQSISTIAYQIINNAPAAGITDGNNRLNISTDEYNKSIAIIEIEYDTISKFPGSWKDSSGQLSDPLTRLQDNYFYQKFSYVIESNVDISVYKKSFERIFHPAGMKSFAQLMKTYTYNASDRIGITGLGKVFNHNVVDSVGIIDSIAKRIDKGVSDIAVGTDYVGYYSFGYIVNDYLIGKDDVIVQYITNNPPTITDFIPALNPYAYNATSAPSAHNIGLDADGTRIFSRLAFGGNGTNRYYFEVVMPNYDAQMNAPVINGGFFPVASTSGNTMYAGTGSWYGRLTDESSMYWVGVEAGSTGVGYVNGSLNGIEVVQNSYGTLTPETALPPLVYSLIMPGDILGFGIDFINTSISIYVNGIKVWESYYEMYGAYNSQWRALVSTGDYYFHGNDPIFDAAIQNIETRLQASRIQYMPNDYIAIDPN